MSAAAFAATGNYTLYYLDKARNVNAVTISPEAKAIGQPRKLTSLGVFDGYSVAPDEKWVVTWKLISNRDGEQYYKAFVEHGGKRSTIAESDECNEPPTCTWACGSRYAIVGFSSDYTQSVIYSTVEKKLCHRDYDIPLTFSPDGRYCLMLEEVGDLDQDPWMYVRDLQSGTTGKIKIVGYGTHNAGVWIDSSRFAIIDGQGDVYCGTVKPSGRKIEVTLQRLTKHGNCGDLRYIPGVGLYFSQEQKPQRAGYYSKDFATVTKSELLPVETKPVKPNHEGLGEYASPDEKLSAVLSGQPGAATLPLIRVRVRSSEKTVGEGTPVARGNHPQWKDLQPK